MIVAGTHAPMNINLGKNEPGMILQRWDGDVWVDCKVDGKVVKSPGGDILVYEFLNTRNFMAI